MKPPIKILQNALHRKIMEHLKYIGEECPSKLAETYNALRQDVSSAMQEMHKVGMVTFDELEGFPIVRMYRLTDKGFNLFNLYEQLTLTQVTILQGKTYMGVLKNLPSTPTELANMFGVTVSDISHHLNLLRKEVLVDSVRQGRTKVYHLTSRGKTLIDKNKQLC